VARENHPEMSLRFNQVPLNCECVPSNHQIPAVLLLIYPSEDYSQGLSIGVRVHLPHFHSLGYTPRKWIIPCAQKKPM